MEKTLMFSSANEVRIGKVLRFIIPTYLTSLFNTLYTIIDGVFVSSYVGTNALAAINIVYPIVNILTGIALVFAAGGSAVAALFIGGRKNKEANAAFSVSIVFSLLGGFLVSIAVVLDLNHVLRLLGATSATMEDCRIYAFWWLIATPAVMIKELLTYFIRADGSPTYSFLTALAGGICNIVLDYILISHFRMGLQGAAIATVLGILLSCCMGAYYFCRKRKVLRFTLYGFNVHLGLRCMINGTSELVDQVAIAITTVAFNRTAMAFAGEDGIAAVSIIMYLQFLVLGIYFGFSMGIAPALGYACGDGRKDVCKVLEGYAWRFFAVAPPVLYIIAYVIAPMGVGFFAESGSDVYRMAIDGMRWYGLGFIFAGLNIFSAIRFMAYGKGHLSGIITFLRSFALLILFLMILPRFWELRGVWLSVPFAEGLTLIVSMGITVCDFRKNRAAYATCCRNDLC